MTREELEALKKIVEREEARLKEKEKELEKKSKVWKPKNGERVCVILSDGTVDVLTYQDTQKGDYCRTNDIYLQGNLFHTREEVKFESERRKVIKELQDFATERNEPIDWHDSKQRKWYIYYNYMIGKACIEVCCIIKNSAIYFSSKQIAEEAIEQIGEDRIKKYYLGVEE